MFTTLRMQSVSLSAHETSSRGLHGLRFVQHTKNSMDLGRNLVVNDLDGELRTETTTIMFADVVESVRLIEQDEKGNVSRIRSLLGKIAEIAESTHAGIVLERRGDGLLIRFSDARSAVACAHQMHSLADAASVTCAAHEVIALRVGTHTAEVLTDTTALYGTGINHAARIAAVAAPGDTIVSAGVRDVLADGLDAVIVDMGDCYLRNVASPLRLYRTPPVRERTKNWPSAALHDHLSLPDDLRVSLAVLPIARRAASDVTSTPLHIGDVLTDQIVSVLSRSASVNVISQYSANAFRGRVVGGAHVIDHLAADYLITGSYEERGSRISLQIVVSKGQQQKVLWAEEFEGSSSDALSTESDLVGRVVQTIADAVIGHEVSAAKILPLPNLANHTLYLAAMSMLHRFSKPEFQKSREMLEWLRERAPRHPAPLAWLARWHVFSLVQGWSHQPKIDSEQAVSLSKRALDLDPKSSLALTIAGAASVGVVHDVAAAQHYYDAAIAQNPNESLAWLLKGVSHGLMGETADALTASQRATRLTPLDPMKFYYDSLCASAAAGAGEYDLAIEFGERSVRANCMHGSALRALAIAKGMRGDMDGARAAIAQLLQHEPSTSLEVFSARAITANARHAAFSEVLLKAGLPEKSPKPIISH